jgi:hypothetical protein
MTSDQEVEPKQLDTTHVHEEDVQEEERGDDDEEEETAAAAASTTNVSILTNLGEHDGTIATITTTNLVWSNKLKSMKSMVREVHHHHMPYVPRIMMSSLVVENHSRIIR